MGPTSPAPGEGRAPYHVTTAHTMRLQPSLTLGVGRLCLGAENPANSWILRQGSDP